MVSNDQYAPCKTVNSPSSSSKSPLNVESCENLGLIEQNNMLTNCVSSRKLEDDHDRKHVSTRSACMRLKSKMKYEKLMDKHVKEAMVNLMKSHKDDSLMLFDYV